MSFVYCFTMVSDNYKILTFVITQLFQITQNKRLELTSIKKKQRISDEAVIFSKLCKKSKNII